jgi:3-hydroxy-3-methylglutaryl CoA synthase
MARGILGWGAYVPRARLPRAAVAQALAWRAPQAGRRAPSGARSYGEWDEDALTMAVDAARDCLGASRATPPSHLWLASTTLPFADRGNATLVAEALGLGGDRRTVESSGSLRAGTSALLGSLEGAGDALVIASDARRARPASPQEIAYGHGAVALRVGDGDVAAEFLAAESLAADFVDHFRADEDGFDYGYEERWVRDEGHVALVVPVLTRLLARAGVTAAAVDHFVFPAGAASARALAARVGIPAERVRDALGENCGDTGAPHALLMLASTLESASSGQTILVVGFGEGVDALLFRTTSRVVAARPRLGVAGAIAAGRNEDAYVRYLAHSRLIALEQGMRAERDARTAQSAYWRRHDAITSLVGGRCTACGTVQFPRTRACVAPECRAFDTQEPHPLADVPGRVKTFTEDWLAFTPAPPLAYGNVELEGGGNLFVEFADVRPGELAVGTPVRFVWRLKDVDAVRDYRRYFWKAAPVRGAGS